MTSRVLYNWFQIWTTNTLKTFISKCSICLNLMKQFKMQISTQADNYRKNVAINKNYILRKMRLKFQNPNFNISSKIAFWNKQKWLNREQKRCFCKVLSTNFQNIYIYIYFRRHFSGWLLSLEFKVRFKQSIPVSLDVKVSIIPCWDFSC